MESSLASLLSILPKPKLLPVYDGLDKLRLQLSSHDDLADSKQNSGKRNETGALVQRTIAIESSISTEHAIARVNQPTDRLIQAAPDDSRPALFIPDTFPRPSAEDIAMEVEETKRALENLIGGKIAFRQPNSHQMSLLSTPCTLSFSQNNTIVQYKSDSSEQERLVMIQERMRDPLSPPRFKHKRAPAAPPSPPPPVLHSPPRRLTASQYTAWRIPPCVSSWKNPKGYTVPLDKRLASDGRHLLEHRVNERFANLAESLYVAEEQAREELTIRADIEQQLNDRSRHQREEYMQSLLQQSSYQPTRNHHSSAGNLAGQGDEASFDPRLFDKSEGIASGLGPDDEAYNLYDRPLTTGRSILSAPTALVTGNTFMNNEDDQASGRAVGSKDKRGEEYAKLANRDYSQPLQFVTADVPSSTQHTVVVDEAQQATADPFGLDAFLAAAKNHGKK